MQNFNEIIKTQANYKKLGFTSALLTAIVGLITFGIALLTPPISGPFATNPIQYPFTDIAARFPRDYIWMYPAMILMLLFIVMYVCSFYGAINTQKASTHIGLLFAQISGAVLFTNYFIQVSVIQPSLMSGETDGIALLTQYNPHGLFVVLEEIGYIFMSLSFLFILPAYSEKSKLDTIIRKVLLSSFILSVFALVYICIRYGIYREYIFEVAIISIDFLTLIVLGILLSIRFIKTNEEM